MSLNPRTHVLILGVLLLSVGCGKSYSSKNTRFQYAFTILASDAESAALARGPGGGRTAAILSLQPIPGKDSKPGELEKLRTRAVDAIESYLDTSRIELDDTRHYVGMETRKAYLAIESGTPSLLIFDASSNVLRVDRFLKSLGFLGGELPTPTPTPTPQLRPIS